MQAAGPLPRPAKGAAHWRCMPPPPCSSLPCRAAAEVLAQLRYDLPATYKFHKRVSLACPSPLLSRLLRRKWRGCCRDCKTCADCQPRMPARGGVAACRRRGVQLLARGGAHLRHAEPLPPTHPSASLGAGRRAKTSRWTCGGLRCRRRPTAEQAAAGAAAPRSSRGSGARSQSSGSAATRQANTLTEAPGQRQGVQSTQAGRQRVQKVGTQCGQ